MNYDTVAVGSVIVFVSSYISLKVVILPVIYFLASFTVVRRATIKDLQKLNSDLEHANQLLRRGILITQDEATGQVSFDLPDEYVTIKHVPYTWKNPDTNQLENWEMVWHIRDWTAQQLGKYFVKRGRKYLWVDELLPNDKEVDYPCEHKYIGEAKPKAKKRGRPRKVPVSV